MNDKIRILFYNVDGAGVNYFRTLTPAMELERNHSDDFHVEINPQIDFNDPNVFDYLKSFDIIHYHRQFHPDNNKMHELSKNLKKAGTILVVDIDDYWNLHPKHPFYSLSKQKGMDIQIIQNLKIADYVTTTTDIFAEKIREVTGKDNVTVLYNSIDPTWMKQFKDKWKPDPDGRVRITYMAGSCYDDQTEILTENGWKLFSDLNKTEKVATLNPTTNELEYQKPSEYINEYYEGDMYYGANKNVDFAVTPNHNMYISKVKSGNRKKPFNFELIRMENLDEYDLTFKKDCIWKGEEKEFFTIKNHKSKLKYFDEIKFKMDDWLMFFGFWLGDGWTTTDGSNQVGICGFVKNSVDRMKEIEKMLIRYGYKPTWTKDGKQLRIFNNQLWNYLSQFGKAKDKFVPQEIKNLSSNKLKILYENYIITDGHERSNGRKTSYTVSKKLADDFSEIALKIGTCATITNNGTKESIIIEETINDNGELIQEKRNITGKSDSYSVNYYLTEGKKPQLEPTLLRKNIKKDYYSGKIYCVTVPNHTLYVKRNDKSYWCGNSHMVDVDQLQGVFNVLRNDPILKDKFKVIIAGWDTEGSTTEVTFNQEFGNELQVMGLWNEKMVKAINASQGDIDKIPNLPENLIEKYRGNIFKENKRNIKSEESVYYNYEKILTDNHKLINNNDYYEWLMNFERDVQYPEDEGNFARRWTQKANTYANTLNETDIVIAPLADNDFNKMKCVTKNTMISTNCGIFKIGDIVNNSWWNQLKIFNEKILNTFKYSNEKVIKLITEMGYEIEGTETHKILISGEWKMLKDISIDDEIEINPINIESNEYQKIYYPLLLSKKITEDVLNKSKIEMIPSIKINENYGRFFGYMLGDGYFSKGYLNITCDKRYNDVVQDIKQIIESMGLVPIIYDAKPDKRCINSLHKEGFGLEIRIPSKHLASICYQENLRNEKGKVFEIPHFILKSPKSVIREFLRGLFEADGTVSNNNVGVSFTTKSKVLAKQIQYLLLGFNIMSKITFSYNKKYRRYYYNVRLNRSGCDLFKKEIGFVSEIKNNELNIICNKKHSNRFSEQKYLSKVIEIKYDIDDVYDIEVDNLHKYNGNGIINHNSNLKQVEGWSRKLPIVCSDIPPYNVDGRHMENCVLIPSKKNARKYWIKSLKKLILDADLRKQLGEQLYEDFKEKYNLANVTEKRANFYKGIAKK